MVMVSRTGSVDPSDVELGARLLRGLADPTRLGILLRLLHEGEQRVTDLVQITGSSQANVSKHLACLRDCGLISARPNGRETFYRVAHYEVAELLRAAEQVLAATGDRVALCPNHAPDPSQ